jgi:hypothetical protein
MAMGRASSAPQLRLDLGLPEVEEERRGKPTWLSPFARAWCAAFSTPVAPLGEIARSFGPLVREYTGPEVERRWGLYLADALADDGGRYASPARFAKTFGRWARPTGRRNADPLEPLPGEDVDAYILRVGRLPVGK